MERLGAYCGPIAEPRVATQSDADRVIEIFTAAFLDDPVWGSALRDAGRHIAQHDAFWRLFVDGALPHGWVWLSADDGAAAVWLPPGCPEFTEEVDAKLESLLTELLGESQGAVVLETFERFELAHPRDRPHYYLSLLGTHPDHRGKGLGMALLANNLKLIDAKEMPAYLESTNPANNHRYERFGFEQVGDFSIPGKDGPPVAAMWREARK